MAIALPIWKKLLLAVYVRASQPLRRRANQRAADRGAAPLSILLYHRVADDGDNDWTITPHAFARQMKWLRARFDLISLDECQQRIRGGFNDRPAVSITFDDGYADNVDTALPLLIDNNIPVTYFVCSDHVLQGEPFPHDVRRGQPLQPNSLSQLRALAEAGVDIGAHTRTHADLGPIRDTERLVDEIVVGRDQLRQALGCPIPYFAFPYGLYDNLSDAAINVARQAGFRGVCSAYGGHNFPGDEGFHLQRIHGDPEFVRFENWLTVDPRKVRGVRRFEDTERSGGHQSDLAGARAALTT
jgi:peptidoglycan/xylan/chitin deacetylase (PgdA/CDA1 family)